jgi:uncharacterized protein (DUF58 family)
MKATVTFLTMLFFSVLYTYFVGAQTSMFLVYMFVLCIPVSFFLTWPMRKRFEFTLEIPAFEAEKDGIIKMNILLTNKSFLPVPFVGIAFLKADNLILQDPPESCLSFSPHETKCISARFYASHRGSADIGLKKLFIKDLLGFFSFSLLKGLEAHQYTGRVTVLPRVTPMKPSSKIMYGTGGRENTVNESESASAGSSFFTGEPGHEFREFQAGDPLHRVHWKLSAKTDRLMVRKSESGGSSKICFILDPVLAAEPNRTRKNKKTLVMEDTAAKSREAEEKLLETLLSVSNMVVQLGRLAEVWLFSQEQWQVKNISQKKDLIELQRYLAQYTFPRANPGDGSTRLPLFSILQQQKMNRNFKGGDAILFTAGYDHHLQQLMQSGELKSITLRIIRVKDRLPLDPSSEFTASAKELLWVLNTDENLSDVVI